jgi:hypothetical protein
MAGLGIAALAASPAIAQDQQAWEDWQEASNETASAERMMQGEVTNRLNMMGDIEEIILDPAGRQIEYVLFEVPFYYVGIGGSDGFVSWDNIALERGYSTNLDLRIDDEADAGARDQLRLTRSEAEGRLVSDIMHEDIRFSDGSMRQVDDLLFDPETGALESYVVDTDGDSLFDEDLRQIPAAWVSRNAQGNLTVSQPLNYSYEVWIF